MWAKTNRPSATLVSGPMWGKTCSQMASGYLKNLPASGSPQLCVALHLLAECSVRGVVFQSSFKPADVLYLKFQYDPVELTGQVCQHAMVWNLRDCGCLFQLGSEFTCISRFGDKAIADNQHI